MKKIEKTKERIPNGPYCYGVNGYLCPFWKINENKPHQLNGYCEYLKLGDWMQGYSSVLWDQVKECDINEDW
jgi:hypothetical protein